MTHTDILRYITTNQLVVCKGCLTAGGPRLRRVGGNCVVPSSFGFNLRLYGIQDQNQFARGACCADYVLVVDVLSCVTLDANARCIQKAWRAWRHNKKLIILREWHSVAAAEALAVGGTSYRLAKRRFERCV